MSAPEGMFAPRGELANYCDSDGMPLVVNTIMCGHTICTGMLLLAGADPNARDSLNCSVLEHACLKGDARAVAVLVRMGADVEAPSSQGQPLRTLATSVTGDVAMFLPKNKLAAFLASEGAAGQNLLGSGNDVEGNDSADEVEDESSILGFDSRGMPSRGGMSDFFMGDHEEFAPRGFAGRLRGPKSRLSASSGDVDMTGEQNAPPAFKDELVPLAGPLDEIHGLLHNACCTGDLQTLTDVLRLPSPPFWLRQLQTAGPSAIRLRPARETLQSSQQQAAQESSKTDSQPPPPPVAKEVAPPRPPSPPKQHSPPAAMKRKTKSSTENLVAKGKKLSSMSVDTAQSSDPFSGEDFSDDDDDGYDDDAFQVDAPPSPQRVKQSDTLGEVDLDAMMQEQGNELCIFFESLSPTDAEMVLRHFKWDLDLERISNLMDQGYDEDKFREVAGLPPLQALKNPPPRPTSDVCSICATQQTEFLSLGCSHNDVCKQCWQSYLTSRSESGLAMELLATPCIGHTKYSPCGLIVPASFVAAHATAETQKMYQRKRHEEFVMNNKKRVMVFCPGADCGRVCCADAGMKAADVIRLCFPVTCKCGMETFCMGCIKLGNDRLKGQPHAPATCRNVQAWVRKTTEEGRFFTFRAKHCPNPNCRILIMKCGCQQKVICNDMDHCPNQACNHMHCKKCDTHFCWICGNLWADHNNYYNCNKELSKELTPVEFFKGCLERYDDHMKNHKLTKGRAQLSSEMFEFFRVKVPNFVQNDIFSESNAVMSECYSVLAYSYVRRHYIKFAHDAEKSLYEMQQGMLENHTNQLLEMYQEFKRIHESATVESTQKSLNKIHADLVKMREFTKLLQGFRKNLLASFLASDAKDDEDTINSNHQTAETSG